MVKHRSPILTAIDALFWTQSNFFLQASHTRLLITGNQTDLTYPYLYHDWPGSVQQLCIPSATNKNFSI